MNHLPSTIPVTFQVRESSCSGFLSIRVSTCPHRQAVPKHLAPNLHRHHHSLTTESPTHRETIVSSYIFSRCLKPALLYTLSALPSHPITVGSSCTLLQTAWDRTPPTVRRCRFLDLFLSSSTPLLLLFYLISLYVGICTQSITNTSSSS